MINLNGTLISENKEVLNFNNRAFKYGDALFETVKVENLRVNFVEDHYFRLMASMRMLRMEIPMSFTLEFFENEIISTVEKNDFLDARVRFSVFRQDGGLYNPVSNKAEYLIEVAPLNTQIKENYVVDLFKDYYIYSGLLSTVKTTNKITNVLAGIYADENELNNCILVNEKKQVVEAINGNVFVVKGAIIKTPPITDGCVKGIIRKKLIELISDSEKYTLEEVSISPFELQKADEIFITNSITGIQAVSKYKKSVFKSNVSEEMSVELLKLI